MRMYNGVSTKAKVDLKAFEFDFANCEVKNNEDFKENVSKFLKESWKCFKGEDLKLAINEAMFWVCSGLYDDKISVRDLNDSLFAFEKAYILIHREQEKKTLLEKIKLLVGLKEAYNALIANNADLDKLHFGKIALDMVCFLMNPEDDNYLTEIWRAVGNEIDNIKNKNLELLKKGEMGKFKKEQVI